MLRVENALLQELGRPPTHEEIGARLRLNGDLGTADLPEMTLEISIDDETDSVRSAIQALVDHSTADPEDSLLHDETTILVREALGVVPTLVLLYGFALASRDAWRSRGRSCDAPLVAMGLAGVGAFVVFTWITPTLSAGKGSYLLPLAVPGAVFFARAVSDLGGAARRLVLALSALAALVSALVFTHAL